MAKNTADTVQTTPDGAPVNTQTTPDTPPVATQTTPQPDAAAELMARMAEMDANLNAKLAALEAKEAELAAAQAKQAKAGRHVEALPPPKMVPVRLHKDKRNVDDVFVSVNGHRFQIRRGVTVEVPDYVAEVLANSERQDMATLELREQLSAEYVSDNKR